MNHTHTSQETQEIDAAGVRTLLRRNAANEVVAVRVYLRGGSMHLSPERAGIEPLFARTARRGTERFPKERLNAELARTGADIDASAGEDYTVFRLRCLQRHFDTAWAIFADILLRPLLDPRELDIVRQQVLAGIRQRDDSPDGRLSRIAREQVYAGHPYAADPNGTEASVASLTAPDLRAHLQRVLDRRNLLVVAVGDLTPGDIADRLGAAFGSCPDAAEQTAVPPLRFDRSSLRVEARDLPTNYIMGQFTVPALRSPDYPAAQLAMSILRDRFFEEVRTKRNLSYAPAAGIGNNAANLGFVYVTAVDPVTTLGVMLDEMRRLRDKPLDRKDLDDKVRVYVTRYYLQNESNQAQAGFLGTYELLGGGWARSHEFVQRLQALTAMDVQQAAAAVLRNVQYTVLGNPELAKPGVFVDP
jgi:zinc protease